MTLIAAGISHRTAPVEERERFALSEDELPAALGTRFGNGVIISTCNRTELYAHPAADREVPPDALVQSIAEIKGVSLDGGHSRFYLLEDVGAAEHLFSVASGIDSMVLGEAEVLGQVRRAMSAASEADALDGTLSKLFHEALRAGRRARSETAIGRHAVSVSSAAVALARDAVPAFESCRALVIGAGEAGKLAARALRDHGLEDLRVTSRTPARAAALAEYLDGRALPFADLLGALGDADIVIASSAAPGFLLGVAEFEVALARRETPLTVLDLAVPRDVDPAVRSLRGLSLYDIDDLQQVSQDNLARREAAAAEVRELVAEASNAFGIWTLQHRSTPTIRALVARAEGIRRAELDRTAADLGLDEEDGQKLDRMTAAIVKRLLDAPIRQLRDADGTEETADAVRRLFELEGE